MGGDALSTSLLFDLPGELLAGPEGDYFVSVACEEGWDLEGGGWAAESDAAFCCWDVVELASVV